MTIESEDTEDPSSRPSSAAEQKRDKSGLGGLLRHFGLKKNNADNILREALEDYMEGAENYDSGAHSSIATHERALISNVLKFRDLTVVDVMIPRADIAAIDSSMSQQEFMAFLSEKQYSRLPVYEETLDNVIGTIHIKDILACLAQGRPLRIRDLVRDVPIVSPSMPVSDLILMMKQNRKHMALVVDEYGGIDGLVTIGDVIEAIIGEVEDEYDNDDEPQFIRNDDGTILADARLDIEELEKICGKFLDDEEREDIDTVGGLVFAIAGHIPGRGEMVTHPESEIVFEILDADPRRVNRVLIRNIPLPENKN